MTEVPRISRPANDALDVAGLTTLENVAARPRKEVGELHGMGPKGMRIQAKAIELAGLAWEEGLQAQSRGNGIREIVA